jgi:hypothetical protein
MTRLDHRDRGTRGTALVAAMLLLVVLSATGLGLAAVAAMEPALGRNVEAADGARAAAEAGLTLAAHELSAVADWTPVLLGTWHPPLLDAAGAGPPTVTGPALTWPALTNLTTCGHEAACSVADTATATHERPWGTNNPAFVLLGTLTVAAGGGAGPFTVAVWAGDDPGEVDGEPRADGGPPPDDPAARSPGRDVLVLRAEAFGLRGERVALRVTASRAGPGSPIRLRRWTLDG